MRSYLTYSIVIHSHELQEAHLQNTHPAPLEEIFISSALMTSAIKAVKVGNFALDIQDHNHT
jgi:hypothetical protein